MSFYVSRRTSVALAVIFALLVLSSGFVIAVSGAIETRQADLNVEQYPYVADQPQRVTEANQTIYVVHGDRVELNLTNAPHESVQSYGIQTANASLTYDERLSRYVFSPQAEGTYNAYWVVEETRSVTATENNTTVTRDETLTVRYEAVLKAEDVDYAHIPADELEELRLASGNWSEVEDGCDSVLPNQDYEECVNTAFDVTQFVKKPWANLEGGFTAYYTIRFTSAGGFVAFAVELGLLLLFVRGMALLVKKFRGQLVDIKDIDTERVELEYERMMKQLSNTPVNEVVGNDTIARRLRDRLGVKNALELVKMVLGVLAMDRVKLLVLRAMGEAGYAVNLERDESGSIVDYTVSASFDDDVDTVDLAALDESDTDIISAIAWDDIDSSSLRGVDINELGVDLFHEGDLRDLMETHNISVPDDFPNQKAFASTLSEVFGNAAGHPVYTDEDGKIRADSDLLATIAGIIIVSKDQYEVPLGFLSDVFQAMAEDDDLNETLQDATAKARGEQP